MADSILPEIVASELGVYTVEAYKGFACFVTANGVGPVPRVLIPNNHPLITLIPLEALHGWDPLRQFECGLVVHDTATFYMLVEDAMRAAMTFVDALEELTSDVCARCGPWLARANPPISNSDVGRTLED